MQPICAFGFANKILAGTVSADQQVASLPVTNLQGDQGAASTAWRFTTSTATLTLALSAATAFRAVSLHRTNLSAGARIQVRFYAGSTLVYDSGVVTLGIVTGQCVLVLPSAVTADRLLLTITEPSLADGFVSIPLVFAGPLWIPLRNMSTSTASGWDSGVDEVTALSGVEYPQFRWQRRRYVVDHQSLGAAEIPTLQQLVSVGIAGRNVLFLPDPSAATLNNDAIFGRLAPSDVSNPFGSSDRRGTKLTLTERL